MTASQAEEEETEQEEVIPITTRAFVRAPASTAQAVEGGLPGLEAPVDAVQENDDPDVVPYFSRLGLAGPTLVTEYNYVRLGDGQTTTTNIAGSAIQFGGTSTQSGPAALSLDYRTDMPDSINGEDYPHLATALVMRLAAADGDSVFHLPLRDVAVMFGDPDATGDTTSAAIGVTPEGDMRFMKYNAVDDEWVTTWTAPSPNGVEYDSDT